MLGPACPPPMCATRMPLRVAHSTLCFCAVQDRMKVSMRFVWKLAAAAPVSLDDYDPRHPAELKSGGLTKEEAAPLLEGLQRELGRLQELCYAAAQNAVLLVLQGMDTSGKD